MGRIVAIDYGEKRTGLAVTDPLHMIATALDTVETGTVLNFLKTYSQHEKLDKIIVGNPKKMNNTPSEIAPFVMHLVANLNMIFPETPVILIDERYTSRIARQAMVEGGMKKKNRRIKGNVDKISAVLILQSYMDSRT